MKTVTTSESSNTQTAIDLWAHVGANIKKTHQRQLFSSMRSGFWLRAQFELNEFKPAFLISQRDWVSIRKTFRIGKSFSLLFKKLKQQNL